MLLVSRFFLALSAPGRFGSVKMVSHRLLDLMSVSCSGDSEAEWRFADGAVLTLSGPLVGKAAATSVDAHSLITMSLDRRPSIAVQLPERLAVPAPGPAADLGFSNAFRAHCSYEALSGGSGAHPNTEELDAWAALVAASIAQAQPGMLDLAQLPPPAPFLFVAMANALAETSMFYGVSAIGVPLNDAVASLGAVVRSSASLVHLTLCDCAPDPRSQLRIALQSLLEAAADGVRAGRLPLAELDISHNGELQDKGSMALASLVRSRIPHGLIALNLSGSAAGVKGATALLDALRASASKPPTLKRLGLAGSTLGVRGSQMLAELLRTPSMASLQRLDVRDSKLSVAVVASALAAASLGLRALHISGNKVSPNDQPALLQFVGASKTIEWLSVAACGLKSQALAAVVSAVELNQEHRRHFRLDASSNPLGAVGVAILANLMPRMSKLRSLILADVAGGNSGGEPADAEAGGAGEQLLLACTETRLEQLSIGHNAAPSTSRLCQALDKLLRSPTLSLRDLSLAGDAHFHLKQELVPILDVVGGAVARGVSLRFLDVSGHGAGDEMLSALPQLLAGSSAPAALLIHGNGLSAAAIERLADFLEKSDGGTKGLVLTQEDAAAALATAGRGALRELQASCQRVQDQVARNRLRSGLPWALNLGVTGWDTDKVVLQWPDWAKLDAAAGEGFSAARLSSYRRWVRKEATHSQHEAAAPPLVSGGSTDPPALSSAAAVARVVARFPHIQRELQGAEGSARADGAAGSEANFDAPANDGGFFSSSSFGGNAEFAPAPTDTALAPPTDGGEGGEDVATEGAVGAAASDSVVFDSAPDGGGFFASSGFGDATFAPAPVDAAPAVDAAVGDAAAAAATAGETGGEAGFEAKFDSAPDSGGFFASSSFGDATFAPAPIDAAPPTPAVDAAVGEDGVARVKAAHPPQ